MASVQIPLVLPAGRLVWGSLYKGRDKDFEGRPLVYKTGPNAGKPRVTFDFGVAIPKEPGKHWAESAWGAPIWQAGHSRVSNAGQLPDFSWKITDGDSTVAPVQPGKPPGKPPCERPGYKGCWVVALSSSFAPQIVNGLSGKFEPYTQVDAVHPGDYVQVQGNVADNESQGNPGVFINHNIVCFSGFGERIVTGVDAASVGFAAGAAGGGSAAPVGGAPPPAPGAPAQGYGTPPAPGGPAAPAYTPPAGSTPPAPPSVGVTPNPAYAPGAGAPPPPAGPAHVMTAAAGGVPYEEYIKSGWTDAVLIQHGKMLP